MEAAKHGERNVESPERTLFLPSFYRRTAGEEKLDAVLQAAIASPSGTNSQPWRVIAVTNRSLIQEIEDKTLRMMGQIPAYQKFYDIVTSTGMRLFFHAPCMIVLPIDKRDPYAQYDCGIVSQSIAVAAQSLGLANRIVAICEVAFLGGKAAYLKEKLQFPENYEFGLAVLIGHAEKSKSPHVPDPDKIILIA